MSFLSFQFQSTVWLWQGKGAWYFLTLPLETANEVKFFVGDKRRGWGSVAVHVEINGVKWRTSIFPHKPSQSFLLPLKSAVRKQACINLGDEVSVNLSIVD